MTSLPTESQALAQNDRSSVQDSRSNVLSIGEEFHGPGFRFVRSFLLVILVLVGCLLVLAGVLSWYFSMDMTVESKGVIEPRHRYRVKAEITGIIQQIYVRQGQQVEKGEPLVTLEDTDWRTQLKQAEKDLEVNQSQQRAIQQQMEQERNIRQAEVSRAKLEVERMRIQLEQVVAEQTIYSTADLLPASVVRRSLEELLPVRLGNAWLRDAEARLDESQQRLQAAEGRTAELHTLEKEREKIEQERLRLEKQLAKNTLRAPAAGIVLTGQLEQRVGDRLQSGETVLEVAGNEGWQARIMVKEIDLPKIKTGQLARLYVDAFPHMEYKVFEGVVEEMSAAPIMENAVGSTVYPIKVSILDPQVSDGEQVYSLAYGMNAEAKVVVETDPPYLMVSGTSFAAPHVTGVVALIRQAHIGVPLEQVREMLQANALTGMPELPQNTRPHPVAVPEALASTSDFTWIQKAALYPFNKEMHALVRARDLLAFEITGIADPVGKGLVGKDAGKALGLPDVGVNIRPRLALVLKEADTLILGYVDQLGRIGKKDVLLTAIEAALEHDCHVFSFLSMPQDKYGDLYALAHKKGLHLTYPSVASDDVQQALQAEPAYGPVNVPVLGVFGTSSQQGKFTLQLILRRHLLHLGYTVGQIGTEHHSALFGMDLAFPMGYASNVSLPLQYYVPYLDYKLRQLNQQKRPDIILVGSQSGTIPYDVHEHRTHSLTSTAFLLGTKPDACILVVNSIDTDEYIQDTIDGLRALAKAPTLLLAMSDQEKHIRAAYGRTFVKPRPMTAEHIERTLGRLEDRFSLPAVSILSEEGQQRMVDTVVNYFAEKPTSCQSA